MGVGEGWERQKLGGEMDRTGSKASDEIPVVVLGLLLIFFNATFRFRLLQVIL